MAGARASERSVRFMAAKYAGEYKVGAWAAISRRVRLGLHVFALRPA
jgi:hypothetical protein